MRTPIWVILALLVGGCQGSPPTPTSGTPMAVTVPDSSIAIPIMADADQIRAELQTSLQNKKLAEGETGNLDASLFLQKTTLSKNVVQVVTTPFKAAGCETKRVAQTITDHVKTGTESFSCALSPWNWGHCVRDTFKDIVRTEWHDVQMCWPEQKEVITSQVQTISNLSDLVTPTHVSVR